MTTSASCTFGKCGRSCVWNVFWPDDGVTHVGHVQLSRSHSADTGTGRPRPWKLRSSSDFCLMYWTDFRMPSTAGPAAPCFCLPGVPAIPRRKPATIYWGMPSSCDARAASSLLADDGSGSASNPGCS